ncbi:MAG TPA: GrpB family protein [Propionibacteriaceae bacterium]|nr:GrpB family protein [Propionibacteriaceae bacterium]
MQAHQGRPCGRPPAAAVLSAIERLGFVFRGDKGATGGLLFVLEDRPAHRIAHLHGLPHGGRKWQQYLAFRDRLGADPDARATYAEVKRGLGEQFAADRQGYTAGKAAFVAELLSEDQLPCARRALANEAGVALDGPCPSPELRLSSPAVPSPCHSEHDAPVRHGQPRTLLTV